MTKRPTLTLNKTKNKSLENLREVPKAAVKDDMKLDMLNKSVMKQEDQSNNKTLNKATSLSRNITESTKLKVQELVAGKTSGNSNLAKKTLISDKDYKTILKYLRKSYPECFPVDYNNFVPLAVGIHKQLFDISDLPFSKIQIRRFLARYTRQRAYRSKLIVGRDRIELDGTPNSKVLETEINREEWKKASAARPKVEKAHHDLLIKKALENPVVAQEFLELYLPQEYKDLLDLTTVNPEKESYIEDSLKSKLSDMVFSVRMKTDRIDQDTEQQDSQSHEVNESALVYCLVEHQSSSDYWIALRLMKYSLLLLERHASKRNKLPVVIPLVLYNGKKGYSAPKNIFELFVRPDIARRVMTEDYRLIDLQAMHDKDINYDKHLSFLLYVMKHVHQRDTLAMLREAMIHCKKALAIDKQQNYILTRLILWYTDTKVPEEQKQALEKLVTDNLPREDRDNIMKTIADSYVEEGFNKGMLQGLEKGIEKGKTEEKIAIAKNLLSQNMSADSISNITGLSCQEVENLKI